jgi:hypothetical protein
MAYKFIERELPGRIPNFDMLSRVRQDKTLSIDPRRCFLAMGENQKNDFELRA